MQAGITRDLLQLIKSRLFLWKHIADKLVHPGVKYFLEQTTKSYQFNPRQIPF
jgi:hypothetical protein